MLGQLNDAVSRLWLSLSTLNRAHNATRHRPDTDCMSTADQKLSAELHGEALLTAQRPELQPLIDHLREVAQGRDDIRVECAGTIAGAWFATRIWRGEELVAAGLLMFAGYVDLDELDRWVRIGWERRRGSTTGLSTSAE